MPLTVKFVLECGCGVVQEFYSIDEALDEGWNVQISEFVDATACPACANKEEE